MANKLAYLNETGTFDASPSAAYMTDRFRRIEVYLRLSAEGVNTRDAIRIALDTDFTDSEQAPITGDSLRNVA